MLVFDYSIKSSKGKVRSNNQDSGYAGKNLLLVADGMGGHKGGDIASQIAISHISALDEQFINADDAVKSLKNTIKNAHDELKMVAKQNKKLSGFGTTITTLLKSDNSLIIGHIGDSRAYVLHNNVAKQITKDHTYVQYLVDSEKISEFDAKNHPNKSLLLRALSNLDIDQNIDISIRNAKEGDRYLICSDGLSGLVSNDTISEILSTSQKPTEACEKLIDIALKAGGIDNITCIVADLKDDKDVKITSAEVVGAISQKKDGPKSDKKSNKLIKKIFNFQNRINTSKKDYVPFNITKITERESKQKKRFKILSIISILLLTLLIIVSGLFVKVWVHKQYYIGINNGKVAIYNGIKQSIGNIKLSKIVLETNYPYDNLPDYVKQQIENGIKEENYSKINEDLNNLMQTK